MESSTYLRPEDDVAPARAPAGSSGSWAPWSALAVSGLAWSAAVYLPTLALLAALLWLGRRFDVPFAVLSRDVSDVGQTAFYAGALTHLGALLLCAAAAVCLFAFVVTRDVARRAWRRFFLSWGLLSALLMCDDLFMLHEALFPSVLGVPELVIIAVHAALALACVVGSWRLLALTRWPLLLAAAAFLTASLVFDVLWVGKTGGFVDVLEDGSKLLGYVGWSAYLIGTARDVAGDALRVGWRESQCRYAPR